MKISVSWLKEFVDFDLSAEELGERLTHIGLQLEGIEKFGGKCENVVVGEILDIQKHPNADKLTVCRVSTGREKLQIVCGAKNMKPGDRVPVALVGAALPNGLAITQAKLRGIDSFGMMCSAGELKLAEQSDGLLILPSDTPVGRDIRGVLPIEDAVADVNVTPNRGDCLSHLGIAREIAAMLNKELNFPEAALEEEKDKTADAVQVEIESPDCLRYTARVLRGARIAPSPLWMRLRLERCGVRPVNNVVDITNYVMLEAGQPLHAFDGSGIGGGKIRVRPAKAGEKLLCIDGKQRELKPGHLVIADEKAPVALAGVMGGKETEVSEATRDLLLESACFAPEAVRRAAKELDLSSESSYRFERGIDPERVEWASRRAASLIQKIAGAKILNGVVDKGKKSSKKKSVFLRPERTARILGSSIPQREIESILKKLGLTLESKKGGKLVYGVPPHRHDLLQEIDLIEEVARFHGYGKIAATQPRTATTAHEPTGLQSLRSHVIDTLTGFGFNQILSYSFIGEKDLQPFYADHPEWQTDRLELANPVAADMKIMRPRLLPSLLKVAAHNFARDAKELRLFESGRVYQTQNQAPFERDSLTLLLSGNKLKVNWNENNLSYDFYDIKGISESIIKSLFDENPVLEPLERAVYHPGQSAQWKIGGKTVAYLGQLHPLLLRHWEIEQPVFAAELFLDKLENIERKTRKFTPVPKYPKASRDVALVVPRELPQAEVEKTIASFQSPWLESHHLFDHYVGPQLPQGKKSLAYSLHYRSKDATLTDEQVATEHERFCGWLKQKLQCELRM